jgi:uncharacterized protein (DUF2147 family)
MRRLATLALLALLAWATAAGRGPRTPTGLWKTIDDETKAEKSLVRIVDNGGVLSGRIEKLLDPDQAGRQVRQVHRRPQGQAHAGHDHHRGPRRPTTRTYWDGGKILDPNNGKTYKLRLTPKDGGKKLEVRGSSARSGRTQTWHPRRINQGLQGETHVPIPMSARSPCSAPA